MRHDEPCHAKPALTRHATPHRDVQRHAPPDRACFDMPSTAGTRCDAPCLAQPALNLTSRGSEALHDARVLRRLFVPQISERLTGDLDQRHDVYEFSVAPYPCEQVFFRLFQNILAQVHRC